MNAVRVSGESPVHGESDHQIAQRLRQPTHTPCHATTCRNKPLIVCPECPERSHMMLRASVPRHLFIPIQKGGRNCRAGATTRNQKAVSNQPLDSGYTFEVTKETCLTSIVTCTVVRLFTSVPSNLRSKLVWPLVQVFRVVGMI